MGKPFPPLILISLFCGVAAMATPIGQFTHLDDIGTAKNQGRLEYNAIEQSYVMLSSTKGDVKQNVATFSWNELEGDFIVRAKIAFTGEKPSANSKIGWQVRENLHDNSPPVFASLGVDGSSALEFSEETNGKNGKYHLNTKNNDVIQLERRGEVFIMSAAKQGEPFSVTQVSHIKLPEKVLVGLALTNAESNSKISAKISNARIIKPAKPDFVPYQDYIGSNLEIMDMTTYNRRIIYRDRDSIQAPNWTHDGKTLIYNSKGLLFNYDLASNKISTLNTGFANKNNNDHVLSWSGKQIAISHHDEEDDNHSTIYTLPLSGSDSPKRITAKGAGHSFLHGYSPDDKDLVFTANRKNQWDIYKINIETGEETQLTDTTTLDDGSEYSPDGKHVYFNSNRTGTMQLWRIESDGSNPTQLTFDKYNDWFPHFSPDGKKIAFLSYMDDIKSGDHPFYRHVYLREMPAEGGEPKIIAYIYGGQGTINVPSWSPDGKYIAFVSNTVLPQDH